MKKIFAHIKITRPINLLMLALVMVSVRYGFLLPLGFEVYLSHTWFAAMVLATTLVAAGGNAVNDARDVAADRINKPDRMVADVDFSSDHALNYGQFLLFAGAGLGLFAGYYNNITTFSYVFPISSIMLWFYSSHLKQQSLWGNVVIAFLAGLVIFNIAIFDVLKTLQTDETGDQLQAVVVIVALSVFSFLVTFARELIKDLQDIPGDKAAGYHTLPISSGPAFAKILAILSLMFVLIGLGWLFWQNLSARDYMGSGYIAIALLIPTFVLIFKIAPAEGSENYASLSLLLKWLMLAGAIALPVFTISVRLAMGM